jgi:hypothetical protein
MELLVVWFGCAVVVSGLFLYEQIVYPAPKQDEIIEE